MIRYETRATLVRRGEVLQLSNRAPDPEGDGASRLARLLYGE